MFMEDFEVSNGSFSNSPNNSSVHSGKTLNIPHATNMAKYSNLTGPSNPFCLDTGNNLSIFWSSICSPVTIMPLGHVQWEGPFVPKTS